MSGPTEFDIEILQECAGYREPRPWGAAVGAALEYLRGSGYMEGNAITRKGRHLLMGKAGWPRKCPSCGNASDEMGFWYRVEPWPDPDSVWGTCWECDAEHPILGPSTRRRQELAGERVSELTTELERYKGYSEDCRASEVEVCKERDDAFKLIVESRQTSWKLIELVSEVANNWKSGKVDMWEWTTKAKKMIAEIGVEDDSDGT